GGAAWEELPAGPAAQGTALVAHGGKLYRIGGMQPRNKPGEPADNHSLASCDRFDPGTGKWEPIPDLPAWRSSHDAAVLGDRIYVVGGWDMKGRGGEPVWHGSALELDLSQESPKWKEIEQPFHRRAFTLAAFDGKLFAVGGLSDAELEA